MQKITPSLWFDHDAEEAVATYTAAFRDGAVGEVAHYTDAGPGEPGSVVTITFTLAGTTFIAINGGPDFRPNPAISFMVTCESEHELDALWAALGERGIVRMELAAYPFSERFGWVEDAWGVNWQLNLTRTPQAITPSLMFVGERNGQAAAAMEAYTGLFPDSAVQMIDRRGPGEDEPEGTVRFAAFTLAGQPFTAMDSAAEHDFTFTEGVSLEIDCADQAEADRYWDALIAGGGEPSQCGWLKDRFGVSWQVVPRRLRELLADPDPATVLRVTHALYQMSRIDVAALERVAAAEAA